MWLAVWVHLPMVGPEHRQQRGDPLSGGPAAGSPQDAESLPCPVPISPKEQGQSGPAREPQTGTSAGAHQLVDHGRRRLCDRQKSECACKYHWRPQ